MLSAETKTAMKNMILMKLQSEDPHVQELNLTPPTIFLELQLQESRDNNLKNLHAAPRI